MGAGLLPDKEQPFFPPLEHEYRKFVENRIYWLIATFGDDIKVYVTSWRRSSRVDSLAQEYY
jgi:hypothetical protein